MLCFAFDGGNFQHRRRDNFRDKGCVFSDYGKGGFQRSRNCYVGSRVKFSFANKIEAMYEAGRS